MPIKVPRKRLFRNKSERGSYLVTPLAKAIINAAVERTGVTESDVMDLLARRHGASLTADDAVDVPADEPTGVAANG
jgi:hypothetical protein